MYACSRMMKFRRLGLGGKRLHGWGTTVDCLVLKRVGATLWGPCRSGTESSNIGAMAELIPCKPVEQEGMHSGDACRMRELCCHDHALGVGRR